MTRGYENHGQKGTRLYTIWQTMKERCHNPKHDSYMYYGAKGISVCDEWMGNFVPFYQWAMSNGYADDLTIDRIDNDGNYEPGNCRWVTMECQNRRHKNCISITHNGRTQLVIDWAKEMDLKISTVYWRLHHGYSIEKVLSTKSLKQRA